MDGEGVFTFKVWLFTIARNVVAERRRRWRRPETTLDTVAELAGPLDLEADAAAEGRAALRAVSRLSGDRRRAVVLRFVDEMSSPRSRATFRSARWMRTRTDPSERPMIPAISAVDISSTKRSTTARRRSPLSRLTARRAARPSSRRAASASRSSGPASSATVSRVVSGRRQRRRRRSATTLRAIVNSHTLNVDAPSPSIGRARSSKRGRLASAARNVRSVASSASCRSPSS